MQDLGQGKLGLQFDPEHLLIPDLNFRTAKLLGLPIPPPLNIAIRPEKLEVRHACRSQDGPGWAAGWGIRPEKLEVRHTLHSLGSR